MLAVSFRSQPGSSLCARNSNGILDHVVLSVICVAFALESSSVSCTLFATAALRYSSRPDNERWCAFRWHAEYVQYVIGRKKWPSWALRSICALTSKREQCRRNVNTYNLTTNYIVSNVRDVWNKYIWYSSSITWFVYAAFGQLFIPDGMSVSIIEFEEWLHWQNTINSERFLQTHIFMCSTHHRSNTSFSNDRTLFLEQT